MGEKPEDKFLDFNKNNIFENLLQAEDHLKRVEEKYKGESADMVEALDHIQCVVKHISMAKAESSEAQVHTLKNEPDHYDNYMKLQEMLQDTREKIITKDTNIPEIIKEVRAARAYFEQFNPDYDISKCKACDSVEKALAVVQMNKTGEVDSKHAAAYKQIQEIEKRQGENDTKDIINIVRITPSLLETIAKMASRIPV